MYSLPLDGYVLRSMTSTPVCNESSGELLWYRVTAEYVRKEDE